jgi:hypothetical protein
MVASRNAAGRARPHHRVGLPSAGNDDQIGSWPCRRLTLRGSFAATSSHIAGKRMSTRNGSVPSPMDYVAEAIPSFSTFTTWNSAICRRHGMNSF